MPSQYEVGPARCGVAADAPIIDVLLIDNEDLVRRGFRQALGEASDIAVVAEARVGAEALRLARVLRPRIVLVDAGSSAPEGRADFVQALARSSGAASPRIIVLTSLDLDDYLVRTLKAGASGFLLKNISQDELIYAVRSVADGHAFICPAMTRRLVERFDILPRPAENSYPAALTVLSGRERQVLIGIAMGKSNQEIAVELYLTAATVKTHVSHILAKLQLPNRLQAALLAYRVGLVRPPAAAT
jgi:DNA-binding NarL/FixJ family response regulator